MSAPGVLKGVVYSVERHLDVLFVQIGQIRAQQQIQYVDIPFPAVRPALDEVGRYVALGIFLYSYLCSSTLDLNGAQRCYVLRGQPIWVGRIIRRQRNSTIVP